jgi:type IV fimbrial biogenesis protein FimT
LNRIRQRGVTLIELMVGVALIGIIAAFAAPSLSTTLQSRRIRTAADSIQSGLQYAKNEALRRNRNVSFTLQSTTAAAWQVGCDPADDTVVSGEAVCASVLQTRSAAEGTSITAIATSEIISSTGATASGLFSTKLRFTSLGRVDTATMVGGHSAVILVSNPAGGACVVDGGEMRCLKVIVSSSGLIRMCDPAVAAGDPRAC